MGFMLYTNKRVTPVLKISFTVHFVRYLFIFIKTFLQHNNILHCIQKESPPLQTFYFIFDIEAEPGSLAGLFFLQGLTFCAIILCFPEIIVD